ncbi:MAG TPA: hypothetical protein VJN91_06090 [Gammaproteobacteria bacterium]|nr:hypothetical protein [Gammaproteobacteria bacterium]
MRHALCARRTGEAILRLLSRTRQSLASRFDAAREAFDIRDVLLFGGMAMLGYGLYRYRPWVAFAVCGLFLMAIGYLMRAR